ncbi:MAG: T9SS type A sorting domain-containing protein [Candidatus Aegiribacteria sp.]|nr:T9SS type A sorting domain-containing protein [Candidatus Aegiribacteria sp.]
MQIRRILLLCLLILLTSLSSAQVEPEVQWTRIFGGGIYEFGRCVQQTADGGYIIVGDTDSFGAGNFDVWLIKTDSNGDTLWTETIGGNGEDRGFSVEQTTDGGYIITGMTSSYGAGGFDIWLIRTDSAGSTLWTKTFGGSFWDWAAEVQQTADGGYIITGMTESYGAGGWDVWLIKTDSNGNSEWTRTFGAEDYDNGMSVRQTADGGYIVLADTYSYGAGSSDFWLIKTNSTGISSWTKTLGGTGTERSHSVRQTTDDGYIIVGDTRSFGSGDYDVWLVKTDSDGESVWTRTFGGAYEDCGCSVQQISDGGYIVAGYTESFGAGNFDVWVIRTDDNGDTAWSMTVGEDDLDQGRSVDLTTDGGFIIAGTTYDYYAGEYNIYLIKLSSETSISQPQSGTIPELSGIHIYPNPFSYLTTIAFDVPSGTDGAVSLSIYDISGRIVTTLIDKPMSSGSYSMVWNGTDDGGRHACPGVYFCRIEGSSFSCTKRMMMLNI